MSQESTKAVQESMQKRLNDLIPIETSLNAETISQLGSYMVQACRELYDFITRLYTDIYNNPAEYGLLIDDKETRDRALGFLGFVWEGIPDGELMSDSVVWIPNFNKNQHKGVEKLFSKTPFSGRQRLNFLERCGLFIEETKDGAYVTNIEYPNMFLPLQKLRQAAKKNYAGSNVYFNCEFRLIANPKYQPTLSDIVYNRTSPEMKDLLFKIDSYAKSKKFKTECRVKECIYYKYKGKRVFNIRVRRHEVHIEIGIGDLDRINRMEKIYSDGLMNFIKRNMNYCRNCFPHHGGGVPVTFFNKQVRICGGGAFLYIKNPTLGQFDYITQAINFGCDVIAPPWKKIERI